MFKTIRDTTFAAIAIAVSSTSATASVLSPAFSISGQVDATMAGFAVDEKVDGAGVLSVTGIPAGAVIEQAYLYTNSWASFPTRPPEVSATFDGTGLPGMAPFAFDDIPFLYAYRWDVTSLVSGDGDYDASFAGAVVGNGMALAVVFSHPSLGPGEVILNDGAVSLLGAAESESTGYTTSIAGEGTLWIYTQADAAISGSGEEIRFDGSLVGGPVDGNLGEFASLFELDTGTVAAGSHTATVQTVNDVFGWHVSMLQITGDPGMPQPAPAPATLLLLGAGLAVMGLRRRLPARRGSGPR